MGPQGGGARRIFDVLADAVNEPFAGRVLSSGAGLAYDLMIAAGRSADG